MKGFSIWLKTYILGNLILLLTLHNYEEILFVLFFSFIGSVWIILPMNLIFRRLQKHKKKHAFWILQVSMSLLTNISIVLFFAVFTWNSHFSFDIPWGAVFAFSFAAFIAIFNAKFSLENIKFIK